MIVDPVVQEMRRHGAEIAEACDGDVHRMADKFRREQAKGNRRVVQRVQPQAGGHKTGSNA